MKVHVSRQRATDELLARPDLRLRVVDHLVDTRALRVVTRADVPRLTSKLMAVLIELVRCAGRTVTREQLFERVRTGRFTTDDVLTQAIKELRGAFGDDRRPPIYIETIPKVGYRLVARVLVLVAATLVEALGACRVLAPPRARNGAPQDVTLAGWRADDVHMPTSEPGAKRRPRISPDGTRLPSAVSGSPHRRARDRAFRVATVDIRHQRATRSDADFAAARWSADLLRVTADRRSVGRRAASNLGHANGVHPQPPNRAGGAQ